MNYSQNNEDTVITNYFKGRTGVLLDIGANDGYTFSNSLALIDAGWAAVLVEPSPTAFKKLSELHGNNANVKLHNVAISTKKGTSTYYDMGNHVDETDTSLLSTLVADELKRWDGVEFKTSKVKTVPYSAIENVYDFITIDAEGLDYDILKQINLEHTQMICLEWNSNKHTLALFRAYVPAEMKEILRNAENVIYAR
jgi:FkbM family methyltransferase